MISRSIQFSVGAFLINIDFRAIIFKLLCPQDTLEYVDLFLTSHLKGVKETPNDTEQDSSVYI